MTTEATVLRPRLVQRVAWTGALCAALGGLLASSIGGYMAYRWVEDGEERELLRAAEELADELEEEEEEDEDDDSPEEHRHFASVHGERTLANLLTHELEEVRMPEPRAAVRRGGELIAGDAALPDPRPGECERVGRPEPLRVCTWTFGDRRLALASSLTDQADRVATFLWAVAVGAVVAAVLGGVGSWFVARWALGPLERLRVRVRSIRPDELDAVRLDEPERHLETEELRSAIADLVQRLGNALDHARAFASQAAHELRTPLTALCGEVELLLERNPDSGELRHIEQRLFGLAHLVERLLLLATPGRRLAQEGRAVDLADVFEWLLGQLGDTRARVHVTGIDDAIVRGDESLLRSLFKNAVDNALKFSSAATDPNVDVEIFERGPQLFVRIVDRGVGMTRQEQERAFTAFYRSPSARASGIDGYGVGLALIAHVATAHGGSVRFLDVPRGTALEVELPRFR